MSLGHHPMLTHAHLLDILVYNKETGIFTWKKDVAIRSRTGTRAGYTNRRGYRVISIADKSYREHRLAWFYEKGEWPTAEIDHRNRKKADNRWLNLRQATKPLNQQNREVTNRPTATGKMGVTKEGRNFRARITVLGKQNNLGAFPTTTAAHDAYLHAKATMHPGWESAPC